MGRYLPKRAVSNANLVDLGYDIQSENVFFKGVNNRYWADESESSLYMGSQAALDLIRQHDVDVRKIDLIIFSALIGDYIAPQSASGVQHTIGASNATAITLDTGCASFVSGIRYGSLLIRAGEFHRVLVVSVSNFAGRAQGNVKNASALIPGDGAGAILLESCDAQSCALVTHYEQSFGQHHGLFAIHAIDELGQPTKVWQPSHSAAFCFSCELVEKIKENACRYLPLAMKACLVQGKLPIDNIDALFTHQPNRYLLEYWREAIGIGADKHLNTLAQYGNLFQASIPMSMYEAIKTKKLKSGHLVMLASFAFAGELAAAVVIRFG